MHNHICEKASLTCPRVAAKSNHRPQQATHFQRSRRVSTTPDLHERTIAESTAQYQCNSLPRRHLFAGCLAIVPCLLSGGVQVDAQDLLGLPLSELQDAALQAYADRNFTSAVSLLNAIIDRDTKNPRWYEMRALALVDGKSFDLAIKDFDTCIQLLPAGGDLARARVGRALALEGLGDWSSALGEYNTALRLATDSGLGADPYVLNSRGNCYNSLGMWEEARKDYLASSEGFQEARGFRGRNGSTTQRLDGAIYASSNAALMLAEIGDEDNAMKEMSRIARRAPGSVDMHAALAALYYSRGLQQKAEDEWQYACDQITVGCRKYQDTDWLRSIRRWPPTMVAKMQDFLHLQRLV